MPIGDPTETERVALCEWFIANGIDPKTVPLHTTLSIAPADDGRQMIRYEEYVLTKDGRKQVDPEDPTSEWRRPATAPCIQPPPPWLGV